MNLSFVKYGFKNQMKLFSWLWTEILFALNNGIINNEDAINYAIYIYTPIIHESKNKKNRSYLGHNHVI